MTEKVKIPQKVAGAIEKIREVHTNYGVIQLLEADRVINQELLNSVGVLQIWTHEEEGDGRNADRLLDVLVNGYEIQPERLRAGDWATEHAGEGYRIGKVKGLTGERYAVQFLGFETTEYYFDLVHCSKLQKSTPEEITEEKERRKWANIGRVDGEFRGGDIALDKFGRVLHTIEEMEAAYQMGDLSGFHPAGSYISFEGVDSNATTHN